MAAAGLAWLAGWPGYLARLDWARRAWASPVGWLGWPAWLAGWPGWLGSTGRGGPGPRPWAGWAGQPGWLAPGQRVSLWVAPPASENSFSAPFVLSRNVLIESVSQDEGFAADRTVRQVNLLVARKDIPGIIHALSNSYYLHLVPEMSDP